MASEMFSKSVEYYMATIAWAERGIKDLKLTPNVVQKLCNCHFLEANKKWLTSTAHIKIKHPSE